MITELPTYEDCRIRAHDEEHAKKTGWPQAEHEKANELHRFIYEHEPYRGKQVANFRKSLMALIEYVQCLGKRGTDGN